MSPRQKHVYLLALFTVCHQVGRTAAVSCGDEWTTFEDSKCLRFYDNFETKDVAIQTCASIPSEPTNTARLLSIKSQSEQNFLNTWIFQDLGVLNSVWLDGNRFNGTQFVWADGDAMSFTNWNDGFPTNQTADNLCIDMSPKANLMGQGATEVGKWKDVSFPIGFIYVQLPLHPSPHTVWPSVIWRDVSSSYAGLFFRTEGGTAAAFGTIQAESSNYLGFVGFQYSLNEYSRSILVPSTGWSSISNAGFALLQSDMYEGLNFRNTGSETRPQNMAVRVWMRV
ncbi:Low affinity immunoglobulin epsilon Fc receptor [Folsomia candida]|uniref:Low affinity immunoglobulin epsilon Fc receptor n=1 Tax=Folsomia candida TaxID=158441 RepID=A0A226DSK9_FOLCA|nr:Low affinity immunoglobulin epsilon Fc receptor [Folsomia candida]